MGILKRISKAAVKAEETIQDLFSSERALRRPLKIKQDILDDIADKIDLKDHSRRVFAFDRITIHVLAQGPEQRAAVEAILLDGDSLSHLIQDRLQEEGAAFADRLRVEVKTVEQRGTGWERNFFHIAYERMANSRVQKGPRKLNKLDAKLIVLQGKAMQKRYKVDRSPFNIGRLVEVTDAQSRIIRRNDLAFLDGSNLDEEDKDINKTVAREHAHIAFNENEGVFRLRDDRGKGVTRILRQGRIIKMPRLGKQGTQLQSGDEIYFGRALVRFESND